MQLVIPALAAVMIVGSIAVMVGIIRRSSFVSLLAVATGVVGVIFFSTLPILAIPGVLLSLLVIPLGAVRFVIRRRVEPVEKARNPRSGDRDFLSDSGHWRLRPS